MAATVDTLNKLGKVTPGLRRAAADLRKAAGQLVTAKSAMTSKVGSPITAGKGWLGAGQPEASVVVQVNTTAMGTANLRLDSGAAALDKMAAVLEAVFQVWKTYSENSDYVISADGTVKTPGKDGDGSDAELTAQVKALLKRVDEADGELVGKLNAVVGEVPPVTTTASPGILQRAKDAYGDAKTDHQVDELPKPDWRPWGNLLAGVLPAGLSFAGTRFYSGGGFLVGPDGRRYPIVAPSFESDASGSSFGRRNARVWSQNGGNGWEDLWDRDPGWFTVDERSGYTQLREYATGKEIFGGAAAKWMPNGAVDPEATRKLAEDGHVDLPPQKSAQGKPHGWDFESDKPLTDEGNPRYKATTRTRDALGEAIGIGDGAANAKNQADNGANYAYEAKFQENIDGRRRVVLEASQVIDGEVHKDFYYVDENGDIMPIDGDRPHHERDEVQAPR